MHRERVNLAWARGVGSGDQEGFIEVIRLRLRFEKWALVRVEEFFQAECKCEQGLRGKDFWWTVVCASGSFFFGGGRDRGSNPCPPCNGSAES